MVNEANGVERKKRFAKCSLPLNHEHRLLVALYTKQSAIEFRKLRSRLKRCLQSLSAIRSYLFALAREFTMMVIKSPFKSRWKIELAFHDVESPNAAPQDVSGDSMGGTGREQECANAEVTPVTLK